MTRLEELREKANKLPLLPGVYIMLDIKFVVDNKEFVKEQLSHRGGEYPVDKAVDLELKRRAILGEVETLKARRNSDSEKIAKLKACKILLTMKHIAQNLTRKLTALKNKSLRFKSKLIETKKKSAALNMLRKSMTI